jgi:hypothetical protein
MVRGASVLSLMGLVAGVGACSAAPESGSASGPGAAPAGGPALTQHITSPTHPLPPVVTSPTVGSGPQGELRTLSLPLPSPTAVRVTTPQLDAKVLVLAADGKEPSLGAIESVLGYLGTPYDVRIQATAPGSLTAASLFTGNHSNYQAVILTTGTLGYSNASGQWVSALSAAEWQTLVDFESMFNLRQVTWYTYPSPDLGLNWPDSAVSTDTTPVTANFSSTAAAAFPFVNTTTPLSIKLSYTYLAKPLDANTTSYASDASGHSLIAVRRFPDGRENMALTFDSNAYLVTAQRLGHSIINWVTRGVYIGDRRTWVGPQIDDVFLGTEVYPSNVEKRIAPSDVTQLLAWQSNRQRDPMFSQFALELYFNGVGTTTDEYPDTSLVTSLKANQARFKWGNHTYTHPDLDTATYASTLTEITQGNTTAQQLGLGTFKTYNLVTGGVTGLKNAEAMRAMKDAGIKFIVSDTSVVGEDSPSPNVGIWNALQPTIFEIPRRPTNLFYNVSNPDEWVAEYNFLYHAYWGRGRPGAGGPAGRGESGGAGRGRV